MLRLLAYIMSVSNIVLKLYCALQNEHMKLGELLFEKM